MPSYLVTLCPTLKSSSSCLISSLASANLIHVKRNCASPSKILLKTLIMASKAILTCLTLLKLLILSHTNASYSIQAKALRRTGHNHQVDSSLKGLKIRLCQVSTEHLGSFSFFRTDLSCVNTVRWVKGGAVLCTLSRTSKSRNSASQ